MKQSSAFDFVVENISDVRSRINRALLDSGREESDAELVCVSKTFETDAIFPALQAGQRIFGENRVQEAMAKWPRLREAFSDVELHLIGPLQSNKVEDAVKFFDVIESVDRPKIAYAIAKAMEQSRKKLRLFIQVNTGEEPQKAGVAPSDLPDFVKYCRDELQLAVDGLMCIPPVDRQVSPHFALLKRLASENGLGKLSMGMSDDFELAIQLDATHVRVGSAIFGNRRRET